MFTSLGVAIALVLLILSLGQPGGPLSGVRAPGDAGRAASQQVLDATKQSRGRTNSFTQQVAVGRPTAAPSPGPVEQPCDQCRSGGGGGGGGGGGSGSGGIGVVPLPPVVPPPTPTPTVYVRFHGRVVDATNGRGLSGVCVVVGSLDCAADKPHTDAGGYWSVVLTSQPYWDFGFQFTGYRSLLERLYSYGRDDVLVEDVRLNR